MYWERRPGLPLGVGDLTPANPALTEHQALGRPYNSAGPGAPENASDNYLG